MMVLRESSRGVWAVSRGGVKGVNGHRKKLMGSVATAASPVQLRGISAVSQDKLSG